MTICVLLDWRRVKDKCVIFKVNLLCVLVLGSEFYQRIVLIE